MTMPQGSFRHIAGSILLLLALSACNNNESSVAGSYQPGGEFGIISATASEERNRLTARRFIESVYSSSNEEARSYIDERYVERQISAGFSFDGLLAYASDRVDANPDHYFVIHRSIVQDDLVFLHIEERLTDTQSVARGEMFRFTEDGKISEHWSTKQNAIPGEQNNNGFFLGSEVNRQSTAGREHGVAIMDNDAEIFSTLNPDLVEKTRTSRYIQHNQGVPNGPDGLKGFINFMRSEGTEVVAQVKEVIAEGDYVVALNYFKTTPRVDGFGEVLVFDLVRVTEEGLVDEHWDVVEEIGDTPIESVFR